MEARSSGDRDQFIDLAGRNGEFALAIRADPSTASGPTRGDNVAVRHIEILGRTVKDLDE